MPKAKLTDPSQKSGSDQAAKIVQDLMLAVKDQSKAADGKVIWFPEGIKALGVTVSIGVSGVTVELNINGAKNAVTAGS